MADLPLVTPAVASHFDDAAQQRRTMLVGMWAFLANEALLFGGFLLGYAVYLHAHPEGFAEGSGQLDRLLGALNTAVLLLSSFCIAVALRQAGRGDRRGASRLLAATIALGLLFLVVKGFEYQHKLHEGLWPGAGFDAPPGAADPTGLRLFLSFYFALTGLHALHMLGGIAFLALLLRPVAAGRIGPGRTDLLEGAALYWHLVDVVWIYLFPLLYLL